MHKLVWLAGAVTVTVAVAGGVETAAAQSTVIRFLDVPNAVTAHVFGAPVAVRELAGGGLLINDTERRQVIAVDSALRNPRIIADSTSGAANWYGPRAGGLIAYIADSTLFVDPVGLSMFVLSPDGRIARVASVPRSQDAGQLTAGGGAGVGVDRLGRLIYRGGMRIPTLNPTGITTGSSPDSIEIDRLDVRTRRLDTVGYVKTFKMSITATQTERGLSATAVLNPIQTVDDWAVLSDGTIAILRGLDYHVDFVGMDGGLVSGNKVRFEWRALSDERKAAILDSARAQMARPAGGHDAPGAMVGGGHAMMGMHGGMAMTMALAPAADLPDYFPAFETDAAKADADANLWVRTTAIREGAVGGPIYDVIDRTGLLVGRVQVSAGRRIVGFGRHGVVYLSAHDASGGWIERVRRQ